MVGERTKRGQTRQNGPDRVACMGATGSGSASARYGCQSALNNGGRAVNVTRRGTVLVMVVGVLSMLFIVGASLLIVQQFERNTIQTQSAGRNIEAINIAVTEPIIAQLREDIVGNDGVPYNRGWDSDEDSTIEDTADFAGFWWTDKSGAWWTGLNPAQKDGQLDIEFTRSGDLLLSTVEPFRDQVGSDWRWRLPAASWPIDRANYDGPLTGTFNPDDYVYPPPNQVRNYWIHFINSNNPNDPNNINGLTNNPAGDADGDGIRDSNNSLTAQLSGMFGGSYAMQFRVVPHGGMVLLDRLTHPSLLSQVIHPQDGAYHTNPASLWGNPLTDEDDPIVDEGQLRRRFMLPTDLPRNKDGNIDFAELVDNNEIDQYDLRNLLPITMGYIAPTGASPELRGYTPHWWPADDEIFENDGDWWQARLLPGGSNSTALSEQTNGGATDVYDRRHLVTTANSDDLLRPRRDEALLETTPEFQDASVPLFHRALNPAADPTDDPGHTLVPPTYVAYGRDPNGVLQFNTSDLRTAFSLRDVLVDPSTNLDGSGNGHQAAYRKVVQLMAYYLAMMQHTALTDPTEQLRAAAQLAVNTIDFADYDGHDFGGHVDDDDTDPIIGSANDIPDQVSTYFAWPPGSPIVEVFGVEKQPFITEAYAKLVYSTKGTSPNFEWDDTTLHDESIFAVELYNPYDVSLDLDGYILRSAGGDIHLGRDGHLLGDYVPGLEYIPAKSYVVIASRTDDPVNPSSPASFIDKTIVPSNLFVTEPPTDPGVSASPLHIDRDVNSSVTLIRTGNRIATLAPTNVVFPTTGMEVTVDEIKPVNLGADDTEWAAPSVADLTAWPVQPVASDDKLVRDTSLQRHKSPQGWHFTLSRQMLLPLPEYEVDPDGPGPNIPALAQNDPSRPAQHNLLGSNLGSASISNQDIVAKEFLGISLAGYRPFSAPPPYDVVISTVAQSNRLPIAPFPIVTADRGINLDTMGCMAFPTTGSLLLVTAANQYETGTTNYIPVTVAATQIAIGSGHADELTQMQQLDNGHLPIFDPTQNCQELDHETGGIPDPQGRLDVPWGQLIFDYFTALPIEELYREIDLSGIGLSKTTIMANLTDDDSYRMAYNYLFPLYAESEPVDESPSAIGPRVNGRININAAPWWVLDGLPALPDVEVNTVQAIPPLSQPTWYWYPLAGVPVVQVRSDQLDPVDPNHTAVGLALMDMLIERPIAPNEISERTINISPNFAKYMVSYRENRPVGTSIDAGKAQDDPLGFVTVGSLCDLMQVVRLPEVTTLKDGGSNTTLYNQTLEDLRTRTYTVGADTFRPFGYLGYLQLVAPIVRLQDWVTVKSHVYTIYASMGNTSAEPPQWLRTQVTVDRTRCLYTKDLPARITKIEPVGYYNATDDE